MTRKRSEVDFPLRFLQLQRHVNWDRQRGRWWFANECKSKDCPFLLESANHCGRFPSRLVSDFNALVFSASHSPGHDHVQFWSKSHRADGQGVFGINSITCSSTDHLKYLFRSRRRRREERKHRSMDGVSVVAMKACLSPL